MDDQIKAQELHQQARKLSTEGRDDEAIALYVEAIRLAPDKSESYYNLGLIYKYRSAWKESFEYNKRAYELEPDDEASRWNLAIAATALHDWATARNAWIEQGIDLPGSDGPIEMDLGPAPVRLNPEGYGEVVWAMRIDPVRAHIDNVPFPESGFRFGDIVLHDGAVTGTRMRDGREYGVFNVLELFQRSSSFTISVTVEVESQNDLDQLEQLFTSAKIPLEIWTKNVKQICRSCSEGVPHEHHDRELSDGVESDYRIGISAVDGGEVEVLLARWQTASRGRVVSSEKHLSS